MTQVFRFLQARIEIPSSISHFCLIDLYKICLTNLRIHHYGSHHKASAHRINLKSSSSISLMNWYTTLIYASNRTSRPRVTDNTYFVLVCSVLHTLNPYRRCKCQMTDILIYCGVAEKSDVRSASKSPPEALTKARKSCSRTIRVSCTT